MEVFCAWNAIKALPEEDRIKEEHRERISIVKIANMHLPVGIDDFSLLQEIENVRRSGIRLSVPDQTVIHIDRAFRGAEGIYQILLQYLFHFLIYGVISRHTVSEEELADQQKGLERHDHIKESMHHYRCIWQGLLKGVPLQDAEYEPFSYERPDIGNARDANFWEHREDRAHYRKEEI